MKNWLRKRADGVIALPYSGGRRAQRRTFRRMKKLGFETISLDLEGFRVGSMDRKQHNTTPEV